MAATVYMIRSFGIVSVAKFFAVFGLIWGCCMGLVLALGLGGMGSALGTRLRLRLPAGPVAFARIVTRKPGPAAIRPCDASLQKHWASTW